MHSLYNSVPLIILGENSFECNMNLGKQSAPVKLLPCQSGTTARTAAQNRFCGPPAVQPFFWATGYPYVKSRHTRQGPPPTCCPQLDKSQEVPQLYHLLPTQH